MMKNISPIVNDSQPGKLRNIEVIYYDYKENHSKLKDYIDQQSAIKTSILNQLNFISVRGGTRAFDTFDDAVDFIDNLGDNDMMIEIAAVTPQILIYDEYHRPKYLIGSNNDYVYKTDIFTNHEILRTRISDYNIVGNKYKVNFQFVGQATKICSSE